MAIGRQPRPEPSPRHVVFPGMAIRRRSCGISEAKFAPARDFGLTSHAAAGLFRDHGRRDVGANTKKSSPAARPSPPCARSARPAPRLNSAACSPARPNTAGTLLQNEIQRAAAPARPAHRHPRNGRFHERWLELFRARNAGEIPRVERGRLVDSLIDGHKYVFEKRAIVYGDEDLVIGLTALLCEIGVTPVLCASGGRSRQFAASARRRAGSARRNGGQGRRRFRGDRAERAGVEAGFSDRQQQGLQDCPSLERAADPRAAFPSTTASAASACCTGLSRRAGTLRPHRQCAARSETGNFTIGYSYL